MSYTAVATTLPAVDYMARIGVFRLYTDDVPNRRSIRSVHVGRSIIKMVAAGEITLVEGLSLEVLALWDEEAAQYADIHHKAVNVLPAFLGYTDIIISEAKSSGCCFIDDNMLFICRASLYIRRTSLPILIGLSAASEITLRTARIQICRQIFGK